MDRIALRRLRAGRALRAGILRHLWPAAIVALAYYAGCLAGFALRFPSSGISFFWPPTAVLLAALLLTQPRCWPSLLAGSFLAHAVAHGQNGVPMGAWPVQFLGNALQALLGAWLVRRYGGGLPVFANARRVLVFIAGACIFAPAVASLIPSYVYVQHGWAADFSQAWRARTVSNAVASLALVPTLLSLWQHRPQGWGVLAPRAFEYGLLLAGIVAADAATASVGRSDALGLSVALYAPAPFLLWATVRFGGSGLSFALLWTTLLTISTVFDGHGPLASERPADTVVGVQLFIAANAIPLMLIAALLEEIRSEHRALVDVEQQNSAILRALPDLLFLQTRDGVYLRSYAGRRLEWMTSPERLIGRNMRDVLPPALAATFARAFETVAGDLPSLVEYTQVVDGEPRRYEGRLIAVGSDRVLTIVRDITERWRSENALREAQQRYALATAAGGIGIWDLDVNSGTLIVEGRLLQILGYEESEIGNRLADWFDLVHPADRGDVETRLLSFMTGASATFEAEYRLVRKDGTTRWIESNGAITDRTNGVPARIRGTYADISERKEAARALRHAHDVLVRTGRIAAVAEVSASIAHELSQPLTAIGINAEVCVRSIDSGRALHEIREALGDVVTNSRRARQIVERTKAMFTNRPVRRAALDLNEVVRNMLDLAAMRVREADIQLDLRLDPALPLVDADAVQMQQVVLNLIANAVDAMTGVARRRVLHISTRRLRETVVANVRDTGTGLDPDTMRRVFQPFYTTKEAGTGLGLSISRSILEAHGGSLSAIVNRDGGATFRLKLPVEMRTDVPSADVRTNLLLS